MDAQLDSRINNLTPYNFNYLWQADLLSSIRSEFSKNQQSVYSLLDIKIGSFQGQKILTPTWKIIAKNIGGGIAVGCATAFPPALFGLRGLEIYNEGMQNSKNIIEYSFNLLGVLIFAGSLALVPIMIGIGATAGGIKACVDLFSKYRLNSNADMAIGTMKYFRKNLSIK